MNDESILTTELRRTLQVNAVTFEYTLGAMGEYVDAQYCPDTEWLFTLKARVAQEQDMPQALPAASQSGYCASTLA
jgi:hypothetical protein